MSSKVKNITTEKFVTTKELANILNVDVRTIQMIAKKILDPTKVLSRVINGGVSKVFNEQQATVIKQEIQKHHNLKNRQIDNVSTELEVLSNALSAFNALQDLYNQKEAEYKNIIAEKQAILDRITNGKGCYSMSQTAKALKLPYGNITLFEKLRSMQILNLDNTPKQKQINNGNFKVVVKYINEKVGNKTVTLTTGKGLVYLAKKFNTEIDESIKADA